MCSPTSGELPRLVGSDLARRAGHRAEEVLGGRAARWLLLTASLLTGLLLAVLTIHLAGPLGHCGRRGPVTGPVPAARQRPEPGRQAIGSAPGTGARAISAQLR
jgi:hypothetical protein